MHYRQLGNTGLSVSVLGFGGSPLSGAFHAVTDEEGIRAVRTALDLGINFIDTAPLYGRSEEILGKALKGVPANRFILATKVGQHPGELPDFSAERIIRSVNESCARLGVDYIDIVQCHDIEFVELSQILHEALPTLVKLRAAGRIGHIGITGLPLKVFPAVIRQADPGTVETILSFSHYQLSDTSLESLVPFCREKRVGIINAAPTGMGLLTAREPPSWHPAPPAIVQGCRRAVDYCRIQGVDIVKLALQFSISHPGMATTVIGSATAENVRKNAAYAEAPVEFELIAKVLEILRPIRNHNFTRGLPENQDPIVG
jgi:L-galactose dehydrogenase